MYQCKIMIMEKNSTSGNIPYFHPFTWLVNFLIQTRYILFGLPSSYVKCTRQIKQIASYISDAMQIVKHLVKPCFSN